MDRQLNNNSQEEEEFPSLAPNQNDMDYPELEPKNEQEQQENNENKEQKSVQNVWDERFEIEKGVKDIDLNDEKKEQNLEDQKPILIVDANAFIKCLDLTTLSTEYQIVSSLRVMHEIRDKRARDKLDKLPFEIQSGYVSDKSMNHVKDFAKKTGDFASLHQNDMEIIAIGYEKCKELNKLELLRNEPPQPINFDKLKEIKQEERQKKQQEQNGEDNKEGEEEDDEDYYDDDDEDYEDEEENDQENGEKQQEEDEDEGWAQVPKRDGPKEPKKEEEDDNKGWINPQNLHKFLQRAKEDELAKKIGIYIMTDDYAMQNVILQMGIPLLSIDNMIIRQTKRFVLECYACKKLCYDNTQEYCPSCKNHSLLKVSCSVNADGTFVLYRKKNFKVNQRGFIYSIPKTKGGRNNKDLVLREDQLLQGELYYRMKQQKKQEQKEFQRAMLELEAGYSFADRTHKFKQQPKIQFGYGKQNPNDKYHIKNKRNKK